MNDWITVLLAIGGAIITIGGAATYISKATKPARDLVQRVNAQDKKLDNDNRRLNDLEKGDRAQCKALLAMLDHTITGNSVDKIKLARDDLNKYLIER